MSQKIRVLDGGMGTALSNKGHDITNSLWSAGLLLNNPAAIKEVHREHARTGADILTTASYQASENGFLEMGYSRADYLTALEISLSIANQVADEIGGEVGRDIEVATSISPYGATIADGSEYRGDYNKSKEFLMDFHGKRLEDIAQFQPNLLAFETVPSSLELEVINELLEDDFKTFKSWVSCSAKSETQISDGTSFEDAMQILTAPNIIARGVNCTRVDFISPLLEKLSGPFVVYPNAGSWDAENREWLETDQSFFSKTQIKKWFSQEVTILGGCCGLGTDYISKVRKTLDSL